MASARQLGSWLRRTPLHPQWLMPGRKVSHHLRNCRGTVLDIGSADRWLDGQLDVAARYIALDYPATAIGLYHSRPHIFADASELPFADGSIDAIACYEVMEHVSMPDKVLAEVARVLAPGGIAEFTMPFLYPVHDAPHDYQRWTRHGWSRSLDRAGLAIELIESRGHSLHAAAVVACLGMAGPLQSAGPMRLLFHVPLLLLALPVVNLAAWTASWFWPSWDALAVGYRVVARKPFA